MNTPSFATRFARRRGRIYAFFFHAGLSIALVVLFHYGLRLRAAIGRLPPKDLDNFLVNTLFKGGLQTLLTLLFLTFRSTKCMFERGKVNKCTKDSLCSMFISVFFLFWWLTQLVQASVKSEWRKDLNLSIQMVARMRGISMRRAVQGLLSLATGVCGIFLFSMMSAPQTSDVKALVNLVGMFGVVASLGVVLSEIFSSLKAQRRQVVLSESAESDIESESTNESEHLVKGVSWVFVSISFFFASVYTGLYVCYAVMLEDRWWQMAFLILPISFTLTVMAFFFKPKRTDALYMRFLFAHFLMFAIGSEVCNIVANARLGLIVLVAFVLVRICGWCYGAKLVMKLRESAAKLPPRELSEFLCETVLKKGTAAIGPMLFFSFESISCFIGQGEE